MTDFPVTCDILITGGRILTMDSAFSEISEGSLAISGGRLVAIGPLAAATKCRGRTEIDATGMIVMPGLINTHCHAAMTLFRGLADDRNLEQFLQKLWVAEGKILSHDAVVSGATLGVAEMALGGITHFVDMYWHADATVAAARKIGIGLTVGPVFIGSEGGDQLAWPQRMAMARDFVQRYPQGEGLQVMLMPHSCYTLSREQLIEVVELAQEFGLRLHTHGAESPPEMDLVARQYDNARPINVFEQTGLLQSGTLIAHAVHLRDDEIRRLAAAGVGIAHCPLSNAKLASGVARVVELLKAGVSVSLGTDGPASSNDLDLWKAIRQASLQQTLATGNPAALPVKKLIAMATIDAAACLGLAGETGSLEAGKRADVMVLDTTKPHMTPIYDPYSALVFAAGREDVRDVIAAGKIIVRDQKLTTNILPEQHKVRAIARDIQAQGF